MDYITAKEAAQKWGVSRRAIAYHLKVGRIPGAVKKGKLWLIPVDAERPADKRRADQTLSETDSDLLADLSYVSSTSTKPMPMHNPDAILDIVDEDRIRLIYEAELAYLRGDFGRVMTYFDKTLGDDAARLRTCPIAIAAAISTGNYHAYTQIDIYLKRYIKADTDSQLRVTAEFSLATTDVSVLAPNMVPDWLKAGDLSAILPQARPNALYLRAKYFYCIGEFDIALALAQTALTLSSPELGITMTDLYLRLTCAIACYALERKEEAKRWLLSAMHLALPHGFITPFAELISELGGLVEECLEQEFPDYCDAVILQWKNTAKNWISFHNQFTKDNITLILSLRECHLALLVARRVPYAEIAKQHCISVGRLKNIMLEIYEKLHISGRDKLAKYILATKNVTF
ncbi:hypothetical protein CLNEO_24080 [Anaerotignum neopropionicum]|uniref:Helix-turn-helix domain protein n=1 Tax=Anaerotignum neopropionicum TaxID=36847 RepID=A0A136WCJ8_9FIRM|nr:hypothetical protein CLNEO_24080 [Anaerotignum neopropionicum]